MALLVQALLVQALHLRWLLKLVEGFPMSAMFFSFLLDLAQIVMGIFNSSFNLMWLYLCFEVLMSFKIQF